MAPEEEPREKRRKLLAKQDTGSVYGNTNGMPRAGNPGRVLHLGLANGELAHRIVVVGHHARAELLSTLLEPETGETSIFRLCSDRGFLTFTGQLQGKRLSVVSIGMGLPMMDFFAREGRAVVDGPMAVVRFGTCGCLQESVPVGSISVASGSILVQRNYDYFFRRQTVGKDDLEAEGERPYRISDLCRPDRELTEAIASQLRKDIGEEAVAEGVNVTADSFYGAQSRADLNFLDDNESLVSEVLRMHPHAVSMEMETFQLFHMAMSCQPLGSFRTAAAVVNVANRSTGQVVDHDKLQSAEREGGLALLRALAALPMENAE